MQENRLATQAGEMSKQSRPAEKVKPVASVRYDWTLAQIEALFALGFNDLLFRAHALHRAFRDPQRMQTAQLLSIKTGGCPEDCGYCSQSATHKTDVKASKLLDLASVTAAAERAKANGATRFCMGAAWRNVKKRDLPKLCAMIREVRARGLESCMTLGMLDEETAQALAAAGLDYYNHNIDTSPAYYDKVVTTRKFSDRLDTLKTARAAKLKLCTGGILGLGETVHDRAAMLQVLATMKPHPESTPINALVPMPGTPMAKRLHVDIFDMVRCIAAARIVMPETALRLAAGRSHMSDEGQALCFFAGADSIFLGERLLTASNPDPDTDGQLLRRLGFEIAAAP